MPEWLYNNEPVTSIPENVYGFVYRITNMTTGKMYIGRKYFYSVRKQKNHKRKVKSESDWKEYYGSCKQLLDDIESIGKEHFRRDILFFGKTKGEVNYAETAYQFKEDVLSRTDSNNNRLFYNDNILSRYFAKNLLTIKLK